jgi:uncharacterized repeat protein (TIGR04052 family)
MMTTTFKKFAAVRPLGLGVATASLVGLISLLSACGGGGGGSDPVATVQPVSVDFTAALGSTALATPCGPALDGLGTGNVKARLKDLRLYVANVYLITSGGAKVAVQLDRNSNQLTRGGDTVALIDLRETAAAGDCLARAASARTAVTGVVPTGSYVGMGFTVGVPESLNHVDPQDAANAPLDNTDLGWDWTGGKKHLQLEISPESASAADTYTGGVVQVGAAAADTFFVHLGNTGCSNPLPNQYQCDNVNTRDIRFASFDVKSQRVALDLRALLAQSDLRKNDGESVGCMSSPTDPECQAMWSVLGTTFSARGANVVNSASPFFSGQTVFKAISR